MKKLVIKTALFTLGVLFVVAIAVFGILSIAAPATMMRFTDSIGLVGISGDYAWQEYENTGDLDYLVRSFLIAAERKEDSKAVERFKALYGDEKGFGEYCASQKAPDDPDVPDYDFRGYLCGQAACAGYRLAETQEEREDVVRFAVAETPSSFPEGNPVAVLAAEAAKSTDSEFCRLLLGRIREREYEQNRDYISIVKILEVVANE